MRPETGMIVEFAQGPLRLGLVIVAGLGPVVGFSTKGTGWRLGEVSTDGNTFKLQFISLVDNPSLKWAGANNVIRIGEVSDTIILKEYDTPPQTVFLEVASPAINPLIAVQVYSGGAFVAQYNINAPLPAAQFTMIPLS
jgi:hypothetical protein